MSVASSEIFSLMLSLRRLSTALWDSRRLLRFSLAIMALGTHASTLADHSGRSSMYSLLGR